MNIGVLGLDDILVLDMADFERIREVAFFGWSSSNRYSYAFSMAMRHEIYDDYE
jgi:hypothetical protein